MKKVFLISFLVLAADQALKFWVKTHMYLGEKIPVTSWFDLHFVENPGMAFGMEFGGEAGKLLLTVFRIVVSVLLLWLIRNLTRRHASATLVIPLTLIFAGAVGNIIDSMFYGLVFNDPAVGVATFLPEGGGYAPLFHGKVVYMRAVRVFPGGVQRGRCGCFGGLRVAAPFPGQGFRPEGFLPEIRPVYERLLGT